MLAFCNHYSERVWVAYMFWSPDACGGGGGNWQTIGWLGIEPGSCATVYANDLDDVNNRYWYFYAQNDDQSGEWSGDIEVGVTDRAFNHCLNIGEPDERAVFYRLLDVGDNDDYTVNLVA